MVIKETMGAYLSDSNKNKLALRQTNLQATATKIGNTALRLIILYMHTCYQATTLCETLANMNDI